MFQPKSPFEDTPKPNAPVKWLKPKIVCKVKFSHFTDDGILRHPVFMRIRDDRKPEEMTLKSQLKKVKLRIIMDRLVKIKGCKGKVIY